MTIKIGDIVRVEKTVEVSPLNFVKEGTVAVVVDTTCPNYARIKYNYKCEWIDCEYLNVIEESKLM